MSQCCTDFELIEYEYKWKIKHFSMHLNKAEIKKTEMIVLKSSPFSISVGSKETLWYFEIYLYGSEHSTKDHFGLFLRSGNIDTESIWASQKYLFVNAKGESIDLGRKSTKEFTKCSNWSGYSKFYETSKLLKEANIYLPNDELTIVCQLIIMNGVTTTSVERSQVPDITINNFVNDFAKFLEDNEFIDVTFEIHDKKIEAHRAILAARSPVFSAMFKHPMKEQNSNVVPIEDMEPEIFEKMLEYIYTNNVIDIDRTAKDLLFAADKYILKDLQKLCETSLCKNVTIDNAAEIYILADRHNVEQLLEYMQHFMSTHLVDVMETSGYKTMEKDHPHLVAKFLRKWMMTKLANIEIKKDT